MPFTIRYGLPDVHAVMEDLKNRYYADTLSGSEKKYLKKLVNCFAKLAINPGHNSLNSHEIEVLSKKAGVKIWTSYVENNTPGAARIFWFYGPEDEQITIAAIEPHPEKAEYSRVRLSTRGLMPIQVKS